jgi:hypothetical protein
VFKKQSPTGWNTIQNNERLIKDKQTCLTECFKGTVQHTPKYGGFIDDKQTVTQSGLKAQSSRLKNHSEYCGF